LSCRIRPLDEIAFAVETQVAGAQDPAWWTLPKLRSFRGPVSASTPIRPSFNTRSIDVIRYTPSTFGSAFGRVKLYATVYFQSAWNRSCRVGSFGAEPFLPHLRRALPAAAARVARTVWAHWGVPAASEANKAPAGIRGASTTPRTAKNKQHRLHKAL
jgi:hypothetical protein